MTYEDRDYKEPRYHKWRIRVLKRDKYACAWCNKKPPGRSKTQNLHAHHIKKWADYPTLRYELSNGVTLCNACHKKVNGHEEEYENLFKSIIEKSVEPTTSDSMIDFYRMMRNVQSD